jgi:hypothetical protein
MTAALYTAAPYALGCWGVWYDDGTLYEWVYDGRLSALSESAATRAAAWCEARPGCTYDEVEAFVLTLLPDDVLDPVALLPDPVRDTLSILLDAFKTQRPNLYKTSQALDYLRMEGWRYQDLLSFVQRSNPQIEPQDFEALMQDLDGWSEPTANPFTRTSMNAALHPGETPLEYRERIGHKSHDPSTWGDLDKNPDALPRASMGTFIAYPCGCRVVGNGTLPYPLSILWCDTHREVCPPEPE